METLAEEEKAQKFLSRVTEKDVRNLLKRYPKTLKHQIRAGFKTSSMGWWRPSFWTRRPVQARLDTVSIGVLLASPRGFEPRLPP